MSRQQRVGAAAREETRRRLLQAAGTEFEAHGYRSATVNRIAASAGVSLQTLYLAWGSKRALLRAYLERALAGGEGSPEDVAERFVGENARERLDELARAVEEVSGRAATGWHLYRDASAVDPEIAADWNQLQLLRRGLLEKVIGGIPEHDLHPGLTTAQAVDTAWVITGPDSYDLLVRRLGYSLDDFREWMRRTLLAALLAPETKE